MFRSIFARKPKTDQPTCTVCLIVKNEGPYLLEWIAYYQSLGFDQIVIYENNSTDNSAEILSKLHRKGVIIHRTWTLGKHESPQVTAYADALKSATTDWMLFIDCDEFLIFKTTTLKAMLNRVHPEADIGAVIVNWRIFGSSHLTHMDSRPVIERFTLASKRNFMMNDHVKSFLRVKSANGHVDMHLSDVDGRVTYPDGEPAVIVSRGRTETIRHDMAQINHYYTKTPEEYEIKKRRGQAGIGEDSDLKYWYSDDTFRVHDTNDEEDLCALKHLDVIKKNMKRLKAIVDAK